MNTYLTVESSLEFDADIRTHETHRAAVDYAVARLVSEGWSSERARETIEAGKSAMMADDGDDWTIEVRTA